MLMEITRFLPGYSLAYPDGWRTDGLWLILLESLTDNLSRS